MAVQTQTVINRQDPEIEAYRLGLLGDTQGLVRDQIFGQNVQNLRDQGLSDEDIAERLGRDVADVGNISQDQLFGPPEYDTADISENEQRAIDLASQGVGAYQPFLDQAGLGLDDASALMGEAAGGFRGAEQAAFEEARAGQAGLADAVAGGRAVADATRGDIQGAIDAQRAIAGGASEALASQALAGQTGLSNAALRGDVRLRGQAGLARNEIGRATRKSAAEALAGQRGIGAAGDLSLSEAQGGQAA